MENKTITKMDIDRMVEENLDEAIQVLVEALQYPSPTCAEKPMGDTMVRWMEKAGLAYDVYTYNENQPNIVAVKGDPDIT